MPEAVALRFYCDEMLARLGRWLRAAGYDTRIAADGMNDRTIFDTACRERRWLLTRDAEMTAYRSAGAVVILLPDNDIDSQVQTLSARLAIDWLHAPFTRCLLCNTLLERGEACHWRRVPACSREQVESIWYCPGCGRIYWAGSHVRRMSLRLQRWQQTFSNI